MNIGFGGSAEHSVRHASARPGNPNKSRLDSHMKYRRTRVAGNIYFHTVNLAEHSRALPVDHVAELRDDVVRGQSGLLSPDNPGRSENPSHPDHPRNRGWPLVFLIEATGWQSFFLFHRLTHRVRPLRARARRPAALRIEPAFPRRLRAMSQAARSRRKSK
jgi:hypothetical protein